MELKLQFNLPHLPILPQIWCKEANLTTNQYLVAQGHITFARFWLESSQNVCLWNSDFLKPLWRRALLSILSAEFHTKTCIYGITLHKKMKFSIKDFFSKCDQIPSILRIWSHWLKKSLTEHFLCSKSS